MQIAFIDVSRASFYAPARKKVFMKNPVGDWEEGGEERVGFLNYGMYGTRDAAFNWGEFCREVLEPLGFVQGRASACNYYHQGKDISISINGDDFQYVLDALKLTG